MQENTQSSHILPVMEQFYTIQGEGFYQGHAAYFIRLAGCDVGCTWCDVKESWDATKHPLLTAESIIEKAKVHPARLAVITGGEPLLYNLEVLTTILQNAGFRTNLETSGAHPLTGQWDWICLSPKKFKKPLPSICSKAHELKMIVHSHTDFRWAEQYADLVNSDCLLFLQPEWERAEEMLPSLIRYVQANPKWQISLQTHKYLNIP